MARSAQPTAAPETLRLMLERILKPDVIMARPIAQLVLDKHTPKEDRVSTESVTLDRGEFDALSLLALIGLETVDLHVMGKIEIKD
jgi:hypothetical protein